MKALALKREKELAANCSVEFIEDNMIVGLGTGSTSSYMIQKLGEKVKDGLSIKGVASSEKSAELAKSVGIPLISLKDAGALDINIDGADEFDNQFRLIKGGGGALLREKIIAHNSRMNIIIADSSKQVKKLGKFKLPIETIPFATASILNELESMGLKPRLRQAERRVFRTDENNFIIDTDIWNVDDMMLLRNRLIEIPGVVETGLFLGMVDVLIVGKGEDVFVYENPEAR